MKVNKNFFLLTLSLFALASCVGSSSSSGIITSTTSSGQTSTSQGSTSYYEAAKITSNTTITSGSYNSTTADENSLQISGNITANLSNIVINKTGDSNKGDETSFYGINSALLAKGGSSVTLDNINVTTNAVGGNGVFSYGGSATTKSSTGDGTTISISNSTITTKKDNSGGIMTTGGGITNATNLQISTEGGSSAAIRTDRGGGTVFVNEGSYTTSGNGSPAIYSTANVSVTGATLTSNHSEGIIIEGKNSVTINNTTLVDTNDKLNGQSTTYKNIFLYQSMSGDADTGTSSFTASDSNITTNVGDTFYVTNTNAVINLTNNTFVNNSSDGNFLRIKADSWGKSGSNGGTVTFTSNNQNIKGNIVVDSISTLAMSLSLSSSYQGTLNGSNTAKSISLTLDSNSNIKLTGNSYVTSLYDADTSYSNIDLNGYKLYVNGSELVK